jgi:hypothetical protein
MGYAPIKLVFKYIYIFLAPCTFKKKYFFFFAFVPYLLLRQDSNITRWHPGQCYGLFAGPYCTFLYQRVEIGSF